MFRAVELLAFGGLLGWGLRVGITSFARRRERYLRRNPPWRPHDDRLPREKKR